MRYEKKNKADPIQDFYNIFFSNCFNLRRKFGDNSTAREIKKIRTKVLTMENVLFVYSTKQSIYKYSEFLRVKEDELRTLAVKLIDDA